MHIQPVVEELPADFDQLRAEARAEAHYFLDRLASDWAAGGVRFSRPGEKLLAAYSDDVLAGVGGITRDPVIAEALRMRRFYVRPFSAGRTLAHTLLEQAVHTVEIIALVIRRCSLQTHQPVPRRSKAAILEFLPTAARAWIVSPDALERILKTLATGTISLCLSYPSLLVCAVLFAKAVPPR